MQRVSSIVATDQWFISKSAPREKHCK